MNTKRTILMLSALATFAGGASMASAQPNGGKRFASLDTNSDGVVTLQEFESRAVARFEKTDLDKDGNVTPEERKAAFEAFKAEREANGERAQRGRRGFRGERGEKGPRGERPDANKTFSKTELTGKVQAHFSKLDKNGDGKLTEDELKFGRGQRGWEKGKK